MQWHLQEENHTTRAKAQQEAELGLWTEMDKAGGNESPNCEVHCCLRTQIRMKKKLWFQAGLATLSLSVFGMLATIGGAKEGAIFVWNTVGRGVQELYEYVRPKHVLETMALETSSNKQISQYSIDVLLANANFPKDSCLRIPSAFQVFSISKEFFLIEADPAGRGACAVLVNIDDTYYSELKMVGEMQEVLVHDFVDAEPGRILEFIYQGSYGTGYDSKNSVMLWEYNGRVHSKTLQIYEMLWGWGTGRVTEISLPVRFNPQNGLVHIAREGTIVSCVERPESKEKNDDGSEHGDINEYNPHYFTDTAGFESEVLRECYPELEESAPLKDIYKTVMGEQFVFSTVLGNFVQTGGSVVGNVDLLEAFFSEELGSDPGAPE